MTKEEFLLDTLDFYQKNPRALDKGKCMYLTPDGNKCAVGRFIPQETLDHFSPYYLTCSVNEVTQHLPEWMGEFPLKFMSDVQYLHDVGIYWDDMKLTQEGYKKINKIISDHDLNKSNFYEYTKHLESK